MDVWTHHFFNVILNRIKNQTIITFCIFVYGTESKRYHQNN